MSVGYSIRELIGTFIHKKNSEKKIKIMQDQSETLEKQAVTLIEIRNNLVERVDQPIDQDKG